MYLADPSTTDRRFIFKQSEAGLNSEFSFSKIGCLNKINEPNLPTISKETDRFISYPKVIGAKWNANSLSQCCMLTSDPAKLSK